MKSILGKPTIIGEKGQALILVIILLLVASLILTPLLSFMSTGLITQRQQEQRTLELYAADAGIEDAIWHLISGNVTVSEGTPETLNPFPMNDKTVEVTIENQGDAVYKITSVATSDDGATTVVSYVSSLDFSFFLGNAVTSGGDVTIMPTGTPIDEVVEGNVVEDYSGDWPTAEQLIPFYMSQVDTSDPYLAATWDVNDDPIIGPLYRDGDLEIINSGSAGLSATLNGTVYVTGDLDIGVTNKDFTLDLSGEAIFVEGTIDLGTKCTLTGSGVIIAVGDIDFSPNISSGPEDFIFVMSVEGTVFYHPGGDFYGSLAGNVEVQLQPDTSINWRELEEDEDALNWPSGNMEMLEIVTWEVSLQLGLA